MWNGRRTNGKTNDRWSEKLTSCQLRWNYYLSNYLTMTYNLLSLSDPSRLLSVIINQGTNSELSRYLEREGADITCTLPIFFITSKFPHFIWIVKCFKCSVNVFHFKRYIFNLKWRLYIYKLFIWMKWTAYVNIRLLRIYLE